MRGLPALLVAGIAALALAGCARRPATRDNVVLVVIDTLRQDHLATYGYGRDTAPFLGELARQGAVFDGLSPASWTKPATASLLTGLHPVRHRALDRWDRLPEAAVTLAERLQRQGYHTLGASTNEWVSPVFGFDRGFEHFLLAKNRRGKVLNGQLSPWLDQLRPPFFLYVHYLDPHAPYDPETGWDGRPLPAGLRAQGPVSVAALDSAHVRPRSAQFLARATDLYDGEIRGADEALRQLVAQLARRGLMRSTVLVVTADHGEELADHGRMSHGQSLYQEVLRVPLVIHAPHRLRGGRRLGRASLLDVVPTLEDWLGWPRQDGDPRLDGVSLARWLSGKESGPTPRRPLLAHLDFTDGVALALLDGPAKLVLEKDRKQLFDLASDPGERHSLAGSRGATAAFARLSGELVELYNSYSRARLKKAGEGLDDRLVQRLAALGYVGSGQPARQPVIPARLAPPEKDWRRWQPFGPPTSCVRLAAADADRDLLQGWYGPEQGGRWSERQASLELTAAATERRHLLVLSGVNFRPAPVRLRVEVEDHSVLDQELQPGPFQLEAGVADALVKEPSRVEIETDTVFIPSPDGSGDQRKLGIFLNSVCYQSEAGH
ncbi:MAG TPA: sulfatase [Thermoanaerobaculia bacterium]|nr:sulfatase [Thermoanaerobaculia bacterium]